MRKYLALALLLWGAIPLMSQLNKIDFIPICSLARALSREEDNPDCATISAIED